MQRILLICLLFLLPSSSYAQYESILRYDNGAPQYLITGDSGMAIKNMCFSPLGDTMYSWDIQSKEFTNYPITSDYLLPEEYKDFQHKLLSEKHGGEHITNITQLTPPSPGAKEWKAMHDYFFFRCPDFTMIIREGPFTIRSQYINNKQTGSFKKYYYNKLVVKGQYKDGVRIGLWTYYPYKYFPYHDIEVYNILGKHFSLFYSIIPVFILSLIILIIARITIKKRTYTPFFYTIILLAIISLLLRLNVEYDRVNMWKRETVPAIWFTFWHGMTALAAINLFFSRRSRTPIMLNMLCLLVGLSFSIFILFFKHLNF